VASSSLGSDRLTDEINVALIVVRLKRYELALDRGRKTMKNTKALPGLMKSLMGQVDHEAGLLGDRVRKLHERAMPVYERGHEWAAGIEQAVAEAEENLKETEAVLGDNGGPPVSEPPSGSSALSANSGVWPRKVICARCQHDVDSFSYSGPGRISVTCHGQTIEQPLGTTELQTAFEVTS
jgi:hypothetical protein